MNMPLWRLLFWFEGRISRSALWWTVGLAALAFLVLFEFFEDFAGRASTLALYPPFFWILAALAVKRMRDRGRSPAWLLVALIPVLGPLWLLIELGLRRGTVGENHYGPDPADSAPNYLTVKIGEGS
ncbi:MAG TPA: DUF805 domain-containing protein [Burkholderiales bacterium]|nr:DUF805 domain-containing protein [Burkholderiales bacterium]